ncbi:zinc ribbon domain-containing protein [Chloroflexota bacterium]
MSIVSQLNQLQEVDLELESNEQAYKRITSQIGESEAVIETQNKLAVEGKRLEEITQQQRSVEWDIDDITGKLTTVEEQLYSGRVRIPKELSDLQHETDILKARRAQLEDKALEIMEQVELATNSLAALKNALKKLKSEWQSQQKQFSSELERLKDIISNLKDKRQILAAEIDPQAVKLYQGLKKQRGTAVARVEQGMCRGCRIMLPVNEFREARTGSLVRCSSCGRILFLA